MVPVESLAAAVDETVEIGPPSRPAGLFPVTLGRQPVFQLPRRPRPTMTMNEAGRSAAAAEIFEMAIPLGGSIMAKRGIGSLKTGHVEAALGRSRCGNAGGDQTSLRPRRCSTRAEDPAAWSSLAPALQETARENLNFRSGEAEKTRFATLGSAFFGRKSRLPIPLRHRTDASTARAVMSEITGGELFA